MTWVRGRPKVIGSQEPIIKSQAKAAEEAGIGRETLKRAAKVARQAPEILPAVRDGKRVLELRDSGMSTREIAKEVGVSHPTVIKDLKSGVKNFTPEPSTQPREALERVKAKERTREAGRIGGEGSGNFPDPSKGETRDKVGAATQTKRPGESPHRAAAPLPSGRRVSRVQRAGEATLPFELTLVAKVEANREFRLLGDGAIDFRVGHFL